MDDISEYSVSNARQHQQHQQQRQQRQQPPSDYAAAAAASQKRTTSGSSAAYPYDQLRDADLFSVAPGSSTLHQQQASGLLQASASAQNFRGTSSPLPSRSLPVSQSSLATSSSPSSSPSADADLTDLDLSEHQRKAINNWGWRVKICFALHLIGALCLLHSYYWFTTVIGIVLLIGIWLYAYSIKQQQTNFVLLYVIMVLANLVKNVLILYFYFENYKNGSTFTSYEYFLIIFMLFDCVLLTATSVMSRQKSELFDLSETKAELTSFEIKRPDGHGHGHGHGGNESPVVKFLISGTVAWTFELIIGHYLEFLKISKQTSELSYAQLTRNMIQHKGLIGVLDGYFPWGSIQCFVKGASFGFGQTLGYNMLKGRLPDFQAEVASGGVGGLVQGVVMSPLLLLKTRVMTMPEMRNSGGVIATTIASTKMGAVVIRKEGPMALMKGSVLFSTKRMADWTTRFFFAEVVADAIRKHNANKGEKRALTFNESSVASLLGGALSATATIPMDVLVATFQSSAKAGQKVSIMEVWKEKMAHGGVMGVVKYSSKGYVARVAHVAATTLLMKSVSTAVYELYDKVKK